MPLLSSRQHARTRAHPRILLGGLALALAVPVAVAVSPADAAPAPSASDCLARTSSDITRTTAGETDKVRDTRPPDDHTFDLRATTFEINQDSTSSSYNPTAVILGIDGLPDHLCVVGGHVTGTHDRDLGWEYLKHDPGGGDKPVTRLGGTDWTLLDGLRVENATNGLRPFNDGVTVRNAWFEHIRDDCVENDSLHAMRIEDSLFDGCYTAFSARPEKNSSLWDKGRDRSLTEIDRVLVRLKPMAGGFRIDDPNIKTYDHLFKWSDVSGPAVIRDSIIMVEPNGVKNHLDWPSNVTADNVTIVWAGEGDYPGDVPSGVTLTRDTSIWHDAKADWLARHGCGTSMDSCNVDQLVNPTGTGGATTEPTTAEPTTEPTTAEPTTEPTTAEPTTEPTSAPETATLSAPTGVEAVLTDQGVKVTWQPVTGAEEYKVRGDGGTGDFRRLATVPADGELVHLDPDVVPGGTYQYRVAAVAGAAWSVSDVVTVTVPEPEPEPQPELAGPTNVLVYVRGRNTTITWDPVDGAEAYRVRRADGPRSAFRTVGTVTGTSFDDGPLDKDTVYEYVIESVRGDQTAASKTVNVPM